MEDEYSLISERTKGFADWKFLGEKSFRFNGAAYSKKKRRRREIKNKEKKENQDGFKFPGK